MTTTESNPRPPSSPRPGGSYGGGGGYRGSSAGGAPSGPGGRFKRPPLKRRVCRICDERKGFIDWKAVNYIRSFVTDRGKILAGRSKGTCSGCQRQLARAIKRARYM